MNRSPEDKARLKAKVVQDQQEKWELDRTTKDYKAYNKIVRSVNETMIIYIVESKTGKLGRKSWAILAQKNVWTLKQVS
jgi:hypothetical protein